MFSAYSNDGLSDLKAAAVIGMVEILAFGAITSAWSVYHARRVIDHSTIYIVALIVALLNAGVAFEGSKRWNRLFKEFESYSALIRIGGGVVVVILVVLTILAAGHFGAAYSHLPR